MWRRSKPDLYSAGIEVEQSGKTGALGNLYIDKSHCSMENIPKIQFCDLSRAANRRRHADMVFIHLQGDCRGGCGCARHNQSSARPGQAMPGFSNTLALPV